MWIQDVDLFMVRVRVDGKQQSDKHKQDLNMI